MRVVVRRVGTLPSSFSHPHKLPVSRPFSLSLFLSRRALSILVLSRTFLPHVLLASRQCLLARRGVAILGRKDSSESALAPPPPSSSALFLPSRRPSLTQDLSSCSLSPFGGSFLTSSSVLRIAFSREAPREAAPQAVPGPSFLRTRGLIHAARGLSRNSPVSRVRAPPRSRHASPTNRHGTARRVYTDISVGFR